MVILSDFYITWLVPFQLWDTRTLTLIKTYATEQPVNAVTMSPLLDHVCYRHFYAF